MANIMNLKPLTVDKCKHRNECYDYKRGDCRVVIFGIIFMMKKL